MLVLPKWQMMWLESQYCPKSIVNCPLPSQQAQKVLEDLKRSCCSPNKAVQLEALRCWEIWINHQNPDDWKLNTVCFTGVRPLITKKLQPLHKDVDICKMKLSLMWALLIKVQNMMQLEGPQYILEVFLQSCLTWLSSYCADGCENEISSLIFQLLLGIFKKNETLSGCDSEVFPPLSADFFHVKKVFHRFIDKFLNIFIHWRTIQDKSIFLRLWKYFLEHCELSREHITTPVWHNIFKLTSQICSEKNETIKVRLAFLHSCATSLKSALSSSKFIDFGNLLATPCEALLKKLVELCRVECDEFYDSEMFLHSKEICEVLLSKSVTFGGLDFCIGVLDVLEEFYLRSLFWGVWCGLVYCYKIMLLGLDTNHFTRIQLKFYRKLRGVAINFELDRNKLYKDCINEVEKHIDVLNISCLCALRSIPKNKSTQVNVSSRNGDENENLSLVRTDIENQFSRYLDSTALLQSTFNSSKEVRDMPLACYRGRFSAADLHSKSCLLPRKTVIIKVDIIKETLKNIDINSFKLLFNCLFSFRFTNLQTIRHNLLYLRFGSSDSSFRFEVSSDNRKKINKSVYCLEAKASSPVSNRRPDQKNATLIFEKNEKTEIDEEMVTVRNTRSRKRAEEEKKKEMERQKRKKRKSFEVLVQEIVRKNKERKTEKNSRRRSPVMLRSLRNKKKIKEELKKENPTEKGKKEKKPVEAFKRKLRNFKKEEPNSKKRKEKKPVKTDGKLENYFKVITKKSKTEVKKEEKEPQKGKKGKRNPKGINCCNSEVAGEKKNETGWRQTSLKMMMNQRYKAIRTRQGLRTRHKATGITDEKQKMKDKKVVSCPLAKLSPFKEVFHDHEYARLEPEKFCSLEKVLLAQKKSVEVVPLKKAKKSEPAVADLKKFKVAKSELAKSKTEKKVSESGECKCQETEEYHSQDDNVSEVGTKVSAESVPHNLSLVGLKELVHVVEETEKLGMREEFEFQEEKEKLEVGPEKEILDPLKHEKKTKEFTVELSQKKKEWDSQPPGFQETLDEFTDNKLTPSRRDRKRVRMLDSLKPSKKIKLDDFQEEKFPLEITEKENLEEKSELISPSKTEKTEIFTPKNDGSPNSINGRISSRALRMIALVPESTKGGQMQWETSPRVEILKCKKAPNVDKNSRASKMLALLSENVVEVEELGSVKSEEVNSDKGLSTTPNVRTSMLSLKSPKSDRKRKFIRFDDAKNETVLYLTDTPPSQILKEKEKCRKTRSSEIIVNLP